jgi:hypothetical protein
MEVEWDKMMGGIECSLVLLGFGIRVRWNYTETEATREVDRRVAQAKMGATKPMNFDSLTAATPRTSS